jgi:hypothetical protein
MAVRAGYACVTAVKDKGRLAVIKNGRTPPIGIMAFFAEDSQETYMCILVLMTCHAGW